MKKNTMKLTVAALLLLPNLAFADHHYTNIQQFMEAGHVTGNIRSYYFNQIFSGSTLPNKYAYSLGGMLKLHSASLYGVSAAVAFYTANSLGASYGLTRGGKMELSIRNQIQGKVLEVRADKVMTEVVLETAAGLVAAVITIRSAENMKIQVGDMVSAVIKATNVSLAK